MSGNQGFIPKQLLRRKGVYDALLPKNVVLNSTHGDPKEEGREESLLSLYQESVSGDPEIEKVSILPLPIVSNRCPEPWEDESLTPEERYLSKLLGRALSPAEREEYYWEDYREPERGRPSPTTRRGAFPGMKSLRLLCFPFELVGRSVITTGRVFKRTIVRPPVEMAQEGIDEEEMNKSFRKGRTGGLSDMMISIVTGVFIAVFIVFPTFRLVGREVFTVIAKSAVRRIGSKVAIPHGQDSSALLPFLSQQFLFPQYESVEFGTESEGEAPMEPKE